MYKYYKITDPDIEIIYYRVSTIPHIIDYMVPSSKFYTKEWTPSAFKNEYEVFEGYLRENETCLIEKVSQEYMDSIIMLWELNK
jgi:hypothetical protein